MVPPTYVKIICMKMKKYFAVYCPYPGKIDNGKILLVGVIGKYEYRPYVRRVGEGDEIEFQCNRGYILQNEAMTGATCVDGVWTPDDKPSCIQGILLRLFNLSSL